MPGDMVATLQLEETEPIKGESTETCSSSLPLQASGRLCKVIYGERGGANSGEDWVAPIVTEVPPYFPFMIYSLNHFNFLSSILLKDIHHPIFRPCRKFILPPILDTWQTFYRLTQFNNKK